jgi:glycine cleavage system aminomethyltransferase T
MPDSNQKLESFAFVPKYPDIKLYGSFFGGFQVWEADDWKSTSLSWKESCYIHAGISGGEMVIKGPDAQKLLSMASINNVYKWKTGTSKHLVMCNNDGLIENHALVNRDGEDTFRMFAGNPWPLMRLLGAEKYRAEIQPNEIFIYQFAGPLSLTVLEKATQESLRDVKFLDTRPTRIPGVDAVIEVSRIGMAGTLAYELRGPAAAGPQVYDTVYQAGKEYGIKRLGWLTYTVNHEEGGFPQQTVSFTSASEADPVWSSSPATNGMAMKKSGSIDPANLRARLRTPGEVDWMWMARFDHDFVGRAAVEAESKNPRRKVVNLLWNVEDILDVFASQFRQGEEYKLIDFPCAQQQPAGGHADLVTTPDGREIGISSATTYSYYYRQMISQCVIDIDQSKLGNEVIVQWGDYGKRIKHIRATVVRWPYLDLVRNEDYDLSTVPSGVPV